VADVQRVVMLVMLVMLVVLVVGVLRLLLLLLLCGLLQQVGMALLKRSYQGIRHLQGVGAKRTTPIRAKKQSFAPGKCAGTTQTLHVEHAMHVFVCGAAANADASKQRGRGCPTHQGQLLVRVAQDLCQAAAGCQGNICCVLAVTADDRCNSTLSCNSQYSHVRAL
jgi:hypothetical protein